MKKYDTAEIKNFIRGAGSIMEIFPPIRQPEGLKRYYYRPALTDSEALKRDWEKVGNSLKIVINRQK